MTQRIGIETPNGTVYLGEECELKKANSWIKVVLAKIQSFNGCILLSTNAEGSFTLDYFRPLTKKKIVPMTAREVDDIINVKRYEWRNTGTHEFVTFIGGTTILGADYDLRNIHIGSGQNRYKLSLCEYRTSPTGDWTKFEKGV